MEPLEKMQELTIQAIARTLGASQAGAGTAQPAPGCWAPERVSRVERHPCGRRGQCAGAAAAAGRTTFLIAHRLQTIEGCDVLLQVEDGGVRVRSGGGASIEPLVAAGGVTP